jgi:hypothetical protein
MTGSVKRLSAEGSGEVYAKDEAALCYNGTWKIVEVTDFSKQLEGLVYKCEIILLTAKPGQFGHYTQEALDFLQESLIVPAKADLEQGIVNEEKYNTYLSVYEQFTQMPKVSISPKSLRLAAVLFPKVLPTTRRPTPIFTPATTGRTLSSFW